MPPRILSHERYAFRNVEDVLHNGPLVEESWRVGARLPGARIVEQIKAPPWLFDASASGRTPATD